MIDTKKKLLFFFIKFYLIKIHRIFLINIVVVLVEIVNLEIKKSFSVAWYQVSNV